ncbi:MAG: hypothetical protein WCI39_01460 [Gallionellaceae bacterium]
MRGFNLFALLLQLSVSSVQAAESEAPPAPSFPLPSAIAEKGVASAPAAIAQSAPAYEEKSKVDWMWEIDPYYTDFGVNIPLTSKPIPTIRSTSEAVIYRELIEGSLIPRFMVVETSIYPMPLLGTYLKASEPNFYGQGRIGHHSSVNILESATAGFQEPWAVSAFFGNIAKIVRPGEQRKGSNVGYTGYLISAGVKHIKNNDMIDDRWMEFEWKIKGNVDYFDEKLGWSFRIGSKLHDNELITDVLYLSLYRSNLNAHLPFLDWISNSALDVKMHFAKKTGHLIRQEYVIGKKYPRVGQAYTPTLDIGVVWSSPEEYSGLLRTTEVNTLTLVFRPSVQF